MIRCSDDILEQHIVEILKLSDPAGYNPLTIGRIVTASLENALRSQIGNGFDGASIIELDYQSIASNTAFTALGFNSGPLAH